MPELPEVETLCRQLQKKIAGRSITGGKVYDDKLSAVQSFKKGKAINVERQGKTIVLELDNGRAINIHLRMTGRLFWREVSLRPDYARWRLSFDKGYLYLVDPRRFATVTIGDIKKDTIKNDLMKDFDEKEFMSRQAKRSVSIKTLLMDPKAVAGIGNIYASEILYASGIYPFRKASDLSEGEWKKIITSSRQILKKGIEKRGTSISDWRDLYGRPGDNQHALKVYGREGTLCSKCGGEICRIKQAGRSTFYCPDCQK